MSDEQSVVQESGKTNRGVVGQGTPGSRLKALWHKEGKGKSLKQFARSLVKDNADAKRWLENKLGKHDQKRSDANATLARTIGQATKAAKRKKKGEGGK